PEFSEVEEACQVRISVGGPMMVPHRRDHLRRKIPGLQCCRSGGVVSLAEEQLFGGKRRLSVLEQPFEGGIAGAAAAEERDSSDIVDQPERQRLAGRDASSELGERFAESSG